MTGHQAAIAQLGERQTEDLKVPGSIPGLGMDSVEKSQSGCSHFFRARQCDLGRVGIVCGISCVRNKLAALFVWLVCWGKLPQSCAT